MSRTHLGAHLLFVLGLLLAFAAGAQAATTGVDRPMKLEIIAQLQQAPDTFWLGSSTSREIDPALISKLTGKPAFNAGLSAGAPKEYHRMLGALLTRFPDAQPHVVVALDAEAFRRRTSAPFSARPAGAKPLATSRYRLDGFRKVDPYRNKVLAKELPISIKRYETEIYPNYSKIDPGTVRYLRSVIKQANEWGDTPTIVLMPVHPKFWNALGPQGRNKRRSEGKKTLEQLQSEGLQLSIVDYPLPGSFGGTKKCYSDGVHLRPCNANVLVKALHAKGLLAPEAAVSSSRTSSTKFLETFDGKPASPQSWNAAAWDVHQQSRDREWWGKPTPMQAHHAAAGCGGVAAGKTHRVDAWSETVFRCNDHVMTSINSGAGYGLIYLSPPALADFTKGPSRISWDVSTLSSSGRDWIDVWITPPADALSYPLDDWLPDGQGVPRNAVHIRLDSAGTTTLLADVIRNYKVRELGYLYRPAAISPSAVNRAPMLIELSRTQLTYGYFPGAIKKVRFTDLGWSTGVVQFGHHSYNPTKGNAGTPGTWHWDNVAISPARSRYQRQARPKRFRSSTAQAFRIRLAEPAPAGSSLQFAAVCSVQQSVNGIWRAAARPPQRKHAPEHATSYRIPLTAGANAVKLRFQKDGWYELGLGCLMHDPIVVGS